MKTSILSILAGTGVIVPAYGAFTYETPTELTSQGDFNGDGQPDLVVLDRDTGIVRLLGSLSGVSFVGSGHFPTGLDAADSLSSGPSGTINPVVAVGSSSENRVLLVTPATAAVTDFDLAGRSTPGAVLIGPRSVYLARQVGQLHVSTDQNSPSSPQLLTRAHLTTAGPVTAQTLATGQPQPLRRGNVVPIAGSSGLGFVTAGPQDSSFVLYHNPSDPAGTIFTTNGLPSQALWADGDFGSQPGRRGLLFYRRDTPSFVPRDLQLTGSQAGLNSFPTVDLGAPIHLLTTVEKEGADQLLALFEEGARAVVYDYQIGGQPVARESWNAPPGEKFTQAAPLGNGSFLLLSGTNGRSTKWGRYDAEGGLHRRTLAGDFACGSTQRNNATLFYFDQEPFVNAKAKIRQMVPVRDWTDVNSSPSNPITSLVDQGPRLGLGQGVNQPVTPGGLTTITNQFTRTSGGLAPISVATLSNRSGVISATVVFNPPAGVYPLPTGTVSGSGDGGPRPYPETFPVKLATSSTARILYRLSADTEWVTYSSAILLSTSAVIHAKLVGSDQVFTANYRLGTGDPVGGGLALPPALDADGDGMPDAWEQAFAQRDPNSDTDGDGVSALQEYLNGTDPQDQFSVTPPKVIGAPDLPLAISARTSNAAGQNKTFRVSWSTALVDAQLQGSNDLVIWTPVTQGIAVEGGEIVHTLPLSGDGLSPRKFYRLSRVQAHDE